MPKASFILLDTGCYERRAIKYEVKSAPVRGGQSQKGNYCTILYLLLHFSFYSEHVIFRVAKI